MKKREKKLLKAAENNNFDKDSLDPAGDCEKNSNVAELVVYQNPIEDMEKQSASFLNSVENLGKGLNSFYPELLDKDLTEIGNRMADSLKATSANMSKAAKMTNVMQDELRTRVSDIKRQKKHKHIFSIPSNSSIDVMEERTNSFAKGMNIYKLLLLCFIGSFVGVVIEVIWCFIRHGYVESRAGLVYGPFNLLYGIGAVLLTVFLYKYRNRGIWLSFLSGFIVGSVFEYFCSLFQEIFFGSRSWDYSNVPFNINGRVCLLYSLFWGALGVLWIKRIYPVVATLILKIPNKIGKILTWAFVVFFIINIAMSCISVARWHARYKGVPASNAFWEKIDQRFPDERMQRIYANMVFGD